MDVNVFHIVKMGQVGESRKGYVNNIYIRRGKGGRWLHVQGIAVGCRWSPRRLNQPDKGCKR